jgi:predicted permease
LLIACANLANLTLARATQRTREVSVRLALGATRGRIVAQLLAESLLVSLVGAAAGLIIAMWIVSGVLLIAPDGLARPDLVEFRWPVFVFAAAAGVLTAVLFGLLPAWSASRVELNAALKAGDRSASSATSRGRQLLTAAEVGIALMLVTGAGLLIRSVANLFETGVGFDTSNLAFVDVDLPDTRYKDEASRRRFLADLQRQVRTIPGVRAAGVSNTLPLHRVSWRTFSIAGRPKPARGTNPLVDWASVSPEYVSVIGLPLLAGRRLTAADAAHNAGKGDGVSLVNQAFAEQFLRGENPLNHRIVFDDDRFPSKERAYQIVGVVGDFRAMGPEMPPRPQFFQAGVEDASSVLALRVAVPTESLNEEVRRAFWSLDKELPAVELQRMDEYFYRSMNETGLQMILLSSFAGLGLLLAMIGVHSVLAHSVASRTREIGIRMALGASPEGIGRMIARQSAWPLALGIVVGVLGSLGLSRVLEAQLFRVAPRDPLTFAFAIMAVLLVAPLAIWLPVRRATRVECTEALREE